MTHTLTHTGKRADGNNGAKSAADLILLEQKGPESIENQGPEGSQPVGKDEVSGSNPDSSSTETRSPARDSGFLLSFWPGVKPAFSVHLAPNSTKRYNAIREETAGEHYSPAAFLLPPSGAFSSGSAPATMSLKRSKVCMAFAWADAMTWA